MAAMGFSIVEVISHMVTAGQLKNVKSIVHTKQNPVANIPSIKKRLVFDIRNGKNYLDRPFAWGRFRILGEFFLRRRIGWLGS